MKTTRPVFPVPTPVFKTARLLLRPMKADDLEDFHSLRTLIEVMKWTSTTKCDPDRAYTQIWMDRFLPPNDTITYTYVIEELSNPGRAVGTVGSVGRSPTDPPEVGYMLRPEIWGKGYATEALQEYLKLYWALPRQEVELESEAGEIEHGMPKENIRAVIDSTNIGSRKVLERCGFVKTSSENVEENGGVVTLDTFILERPN